jgi:transcriptional regulator with XRE-family HTH domain
MAISATNDMNDPEFRKLLAQEELILEMTETICELLEKEQISRKELADRLGKSKGFVSQLLNGGRNLTLRTVADILHVLGYKIFLYPQKERKQERRNNVIEFAKFQTRSEAIKKPIYKQGELKVAFRSNYTHRKVTGSI